MPRYSSLNIANFVQAAYSFVSSKFMVARSRLINHRRIEIHDSPTRATGKLCWPKRIDTIHKTASIASLVAMILVVTPSWSAPMWMAHRGGDVDTDENTLNAYRLAAQLGMQFIECDPRPTKDGVLVSMHDYTVNRVTNGHGRVENMTLSEIKSLRTRRGNQVPTIEEILTFAKIAGIGVYLDTKPLLGVYLQRLMELVVKTGMEGRVIVGVYGTDQLKWMHQNYPRVEVCISWPAPPQTLAQAKSLGASWIGTIAPLAARWVIERAHKHGLKVVTMEINDPETIWQKIEAGIDAIQTDNPRLKKQFTHSPVED